jgi:hypothetical protein
VGFGRKSRFVVRRLGERTAQIIAPGASNMNCHFCGRAIEIRERVGFRDECPGCERPVHICRNCGFYDPAYNNSCREPMAERVVDKDRANFCEYFNPAKAGAKPAASARTSPRAKLEELFKKK